MIKLRELQKKDAVLMLEWMHDPEVQKNFQKSMQDMTLEDAETFCVNSNIPEELQEGLSIHFAIVDERDEYLGTISLKDISLENRAAEYAISMRPKAQGKGYAQCATGLLLKKAFEEYHLHKIFLNVLAYNTRAIHLYEKCGFVHEGTDRKHVCIAGKYETWEWYGLLQEEFNPDLFQMR